jgi:hypothetical protein
MFSVNCDAGATLELPFRSTGCELMIHLSAARSRAAIFDQASATTGSFSIDLRPGRLRHRICEGSTASRSAGQRVNSACRAHISSRRAS